ncbi:enoyl-CoA hydratase [Halorhabdus sp. CBA1104]|uniref:enoyl-CoA hydratase/isomerase family protein n=1 Tax=Halorhabdus sp. CBA1104 TaxID=1380432 RepID=UPI0012B26384|nr:enoyl-CoA hydratase-related protein [Halorhabdus sp. CBA1104]QGN07001.1 enoyl-CoA hydratase [Halorhabdus sp. CBA1104]
MATPVRSEFADDIATVTIDAEATRNVLNPAVVAGLEDALDDISGARCLVVQGAGETFCAGGDVTGVIREATGDLSADALLDRLAAIDDIIRRIVHFPAPTIAAVDGPAFGTGASLALACDLIVASTAGKIGFGFRRLGLAPAGGATYLLPEAVGLATAKELLFTGALLDATQADQYGLFDRVFGVEEFHRGLAQLVGRLVDAPRAVQAATKRTLGADREQLVAAMAAERATQRHLLGTAAHRECVQTFLDGA